MPIQQPTHCAPPSQLLLPLEVPKQPVLLRRALDLFPLAPQQVWKTLTDEQRSELRHQLIPILQEVIRHANQHR